MGKGWSIFFFVVLFATFAIWFVAPFFNWWLPVNVSSFGGRADGLFYLILAMTAFFFVLTEVVLCYAMYRFAARTDEKSVYTHGNHKLEMVWTLIPAALLILIAVVQIPVWAQMKYQKDMPGPEVTVTVMARQWEWRMRYPVEPGRFFYPANEDAKQAEKMRQARAWAEAPEFDDVHVANELHTWKNANTKVYLRTQDVLHSFSIPNLRIKQDTLPGKTIPMWFRAELSNCSFDPVTKQIIESGNKRDAWEIACQELCGGRHYAMRGRLYVHENEASYRAWLEHAKTLQNTREPEKTGAN